MPQAPVTDKERRQIIFNFVVTFFCPTVLTKILILYFGLNYAEHPGEGYGYGLVASICFTLFMFARFIYTYWGHEELL